MAKLLKGGKDLSITEIEPADKEEGFTLEECYRLNECNLVEVVDLMDGRILICDEEGALKDMPVVNETATALASLAHERWFPIVGTCILCNEEEFK